MTHYRTIVRSAPLLVVGFLLAAFTALPLSTAQAQSIPGRIDPGRLGERFTPPPVPRVTPEAIVPQAKQQTPPPNAELIRFTLTSLIVEGATALPAEALREEYAALLGKEISLAEVYQIASRITARYGNAGYLLARAIVPPQEIVGGVLRVRVVEGYIDKIEVNFEGEGAIARQDLLEYYQGRIRADRPLHVATLERYLLLANDLGGLKVRSVLRPSRDNPGAATLTLEVEPRPTRWTGTLDNRGNPEVGPWQMTLGASVPSLLGRLDLTDVQVALTPWDSEELRYLFLSHRETLNGEGVEAGASLTRSLSKPGELLIPLEVESSSTSLDMWAAYPILRSRGANLSLAAHFEASDTEVAQLGATVSDDRLRVLRLRAEYDFADEGGGANLIQATLSRGLDLLGADANSRYRTRPEFTRIELQAARYQPLTERAHAALRLGGQWSPEALPSSEQLGIGGAIFGRGYDPSEWTGDQGLAASLELVYQFPSEALAKPAIYGFFDYGAVFTHYPTPGDRSRHDAASAGVGVRLGSDHFHLDLQGAKPLDERFDPREGRDWRGFVRVQLDY